MPAAELVHGFVAAVANVFGGAAAVGLGQLELTRVKEGLSGGQIGVGTGGVAEAHGGVLLDAAAAVADEHS